MSEGEAQGYAFGKGKTLLPRYQERLKALNAADFGDLLLHTLTILKAYPDILADYRDRFRYMLVDEYQDTNVVQYLWLNLLAKGSGNVCVVGDGDQTHLWLARRGSGKHPALRARLSGRQGDPAGAQLPLHLRHSGRGLGLIAANKGRLGKTLWTEGDQGEKDPRRGGVGCREEARNVASGSRRPASPGPQLGADGDSGARLVPDARDSKIALFRWGFPIA